MKSCDERDKLVLDVGYDLLNLIVKTLMRSFDFSQDDIDELMCEVELEIDRRIEDGI